MKCLVVIIASLTSLSVMAANGQRLTPSEYVSKWKNAAIEEMKTNKIPASITLAQAILESGSGNSLLAVKANNHFGIKCHGWKGDSFYKDDDRVHECFRKYKNAELSYLDHSKLLKKTRYAKLFTYDITDYKSWAKGLKEAGYATSPTYAKKLIDLIERMELYKYDRGQGKRIEENILAQKEISPVEKKPLGIAKIRMANEHVVKTHRNKIKYIVAKKGDTYYRISKEFKIGLWQLYKYNDYSSKKDYLVPGDIVYLESKKRNSNSKKSITAMKDISLRSIAQREGIKIQRLMKMNQASSPDFVVEKGNRVTLK